MKANVVALTRNTTVTPGGLAVTDFADYLKVTYATNQAVIDAVWAAAIEYIDGIGWLNICDKTITAIADQWGDGEFEFEYSGTLTAITVTYFDSDNASQTLSLSAGEYYLERHDDNSCTLHITKSSLPDVYDRDDAIRIQITIGNTDLGNGSKVFALAVYQLGAYFFECRVNEKEPQMTVVEKLVMGIRQKVY